MRIHYLSLPKLEAVDNRRNRAHIVGHRELNELLVDKVHERDAPRVGERVVFGAAAGHVGVQPRLMRERESTRMGREDAITQTTTMNVK